MAKFDPTRLGVTFDDVYLKPRYSAVLPSDVDVRTRLSRHITVTSPSSPRPWTR